MQRGCFAETSFAARLFRGDEAATRAFRPRSATRRRYCADANPSREEHWRYRQRWPHAHCVVTEPYAKQVHFVVDLGEDAIYHYGFDDAAGRLACRGATRLARGGGPRHVVFHPTKPAAFVVNELASTVSAFRYDAAAAAAHAGVKTEDDETAALRRCGAPVSTLPGGYDNAHHCVRPAALSSDRELRRRGGAATRGPPAPSPRLRDRPRRRRGGAATRGPPASSCKRSYAGRA